MSRKSRTSFLEEGVELLVRHFGMEQVQTALAKVAKTQISPANGDAQRPSLAREQQTPSNITDDLEELREKDPEKYALLAEFYVHLKDGSVLPEPQDIRQFADLVGLKDIGGKARRYMVPKLVRFLIDQPIERLKSDIHKATDISEQQRQQGFSILTDKLLSDINGRQ
jgi:hypothetical protein